MAVRGIDHDDIDAGLDQAFRAGIARLADRSGGADAQPALLVLAGIGIGHRLLDILHGDEADAAIVAVDHQKLLDAMLMQKPLGLVLADVFAHRDEALLGHQLGDFLPLVGGKAHVAIGEDADELAGRPCRCRPRRPERRKCDAPASASAHRPSVAVGAMVRGFTTMPDSNFFTWRTCAACNSGSRLRCRMPIPPACAMAMAIFASVTVSMAEAMIGMLSRILGVIRERTSTSDGRTSDRPGFNNTSSKVYASGGGSLEIAAIANSAWPAMTGHRIGGTPCGRPEPKSVAQLDDPLLGWRRSIACLGRN